MLCYLDATITIRSVSVRTSRLDRISGMSLSFLELLALLNKLETYQQPGLTWLNTQIQIMSGAKKLFIGMS